MNMITFTTQERRARGQALLNFEAVPDGHTNRGTESCGTSANSTAPASLWVDRYSFSSSKKRFERLDGEPAMNHAVK